MAAFKKGQSGNPRGRRPGVPNKITGELKDMILGALSDAGGQEYLTRQATANPTAFMGLVGKVLPLQFGDGTKGKLVVEWQSEK